MQLILTGLGGVKMIGISTVSRDFRIKPHTLREWEKREWLGDVLKDPDKNNQRIYTQDQVERIKFIQNVIEEQQKKGMKRTNLEEVEEKLVEEFGGMVKPVQTGVVMHPNSVDQFTELLQLQNRKIMELETLILEQQKLFPSDTSKNLEEIKKELIESKKREEKTEQIIADMNEKLQKSVDFIIKMEENESEKKTFWKRLFK